MASPQQSLLIANTKPKNWELSRQHLFSNNFTGVTASSNGQFMVACVGNGRIMRSTDYGETWDFSGSNVAATDIAISSNGQYVYVSHSTGILKSTDFGLNWSSIKTTGKYSSICCSSDGLVVAACLAS